MKIRKSSIVILALIIVAFVFVASSLTSYVEKHRVHDTGYKDLDGKTVDTPELHSEVSPDKVKKMNVKSTRMYVDIPSVGMHNRVKKMSAIKGHSLYPPGFRNMYMLRGYGTPKKDKGTTYLLTHAIKNARAPGNDLISMGRQKITIHKNARIIVDGVTYRVKERRVISKSALPQDDVWEQNSDKLAIITCMQKLHGVATENAVIVAYKDKPKPKPSPTSTSSVIPTPKATPTR